MKKHIKEQQLKKQNNKKKTFRKKVFLQKSKGYVKKLKQKNKLKEAGIMGHY